ncbi:hypothetical protein QFC19_000427 [Naganishia cerealis]|uniref:Uncharacterized protein n=1 Tax=Naganishia cerealis TaxID=610337 RepID=A0ACC2WP86_9TREE|nr:hypothetical protein QFC19_000427 [Naganishia cerealis]
MDRQFPALNAHNIFLAEDYKGSFDDIFRRRGMPREPSFYVNVPARMYVPPLSAQPPQIIHLSFPWRACSDPSAAPEGKDGLTILVPIGHMDPSPERTAEEWDVLVAQAKRQVVEVMEGRLGLEAGELEKMIVWEQVNTPATWKEKFNLTHGSILGISHDFFNVLAFRTSALRPDVVAAVRLLILRSI